MRKSLHVLVARGGSELEKPLRHIVGVQLDEFDVANDSRLAVGKFGEQAADALVRQAVVGRQQRVARFHVAEHVWLALREKHFEPIERQRAVASRLSALFRAFALVALALLPLRCLRGRRRRRLRRRVHNACKRLRRRRDGLDRVGGSGGVWRTDCRRRAGRASAARRRELARMRVRKSWQRRFGAPVKHVGAEKRRQSEACERARHGVERARVIFKAREQIHAKHAGAARR